MKKNIIENKKKVLISIGLLLYIVTTYFFFFRPYWLNKNKKATIITDNQVLMNYEEGSWKQNYINSGLYSDYDIYIDNKKIGKYNIMSTSSRLYLKDKKENFKDFNGSLLGITSNVSLNLINFKIDNLIKYDENIDEFIKMNSLYEYYADTLLGYDKYMIDIDGDKKDEELYFVSTAFIEEEHDIYFSAIFMVKNSKIQIISYQTFNNDVSLSEKYNWRFINGVKFYKDKILLVEKQYYSLSHENCNEIFQYKKGIFKKVLSCD